MEGRGLRHHREHLGPAGASTSAADKDVSISLYSQGNGFEDPRHVVTVKKTTYTTQDAEGVEVDDAGKGGQVDADAEGIAPRREGPREGPVQLLTRRRLAWWARSGPAPPANTLVRC